jgi:hypothetical protein
MNRKICIEVQVSTSRPPKYLLSSAHGIFLPTNLEDENMDGDCAHTLEQFRSNQQTPKKETQHDTRSLANHLMYNFISEYNPTPTLFSVHPSLTSLSLSTNSAQENTAQSYSDHHTPFSAVVANPEPALELQPVPAAPCHAE